MQGALVGVACSQGDKLSELASGFVRGLRPLQLPPPPPLLQWLACAPQALSLSAVVAREWRELRAATATTRVRQRKLSDKFKTNPHQQLLHF